jgi:hypothetical protein
MPGRVFGTEGGPGRGCCSVGPEPERPAGNPLNLTVLLGRRGRPVAAAAWAVMGVAGRGTGAASRGGAGRGGPRGPERRLAIRVWKGSPYTGRKPGVRRIGTRGGQAVIRNSRGHIQLEGGYGV